MQKILKIITICALLTSPVSQMFCMQEAVPNVAIPATAGKSKIHIPIKKGAIITAAIAAGIAIYITKNKYVIAAAASISTVLCCYGYLAKKIKKNKQMRAEKQDTLQPILNIALLPVSASGNLEQAQLLIEHGVDVNIKDTNGDTALILAADKGHTEIVQLLLDRGADVTDKNQNGKTALLLAAMSGHTNIAQLLLERGADVNARDRDGGTALLYATQYGHYWQHTLKQSSHLYL